MRYLIFTIVLFFAAGSCIFAQDEPRAAQLSADNVTVAPENPQVPAQSAPAEPEPVMEIKQIEAEKPLYAFELRDVEIGDLLRVLAHDYKLNLLVDKEVSGKITASLNAISLEEALETIAESQNLSLKKKGNVIRVAPNIITKIFKLKFIEARELLESFSSSDDTSSDTSTASSENATEEAAAAEGESTASSEDSASAQSLPNTIYDLLSDKGKVLLGKQPNSLVVMDYPPYVEKIEAYLKEIDQKIDSRVFKLKYLKAADVVGQGNTNSTSTTDTSYNSTNTTAVSGS